MCSRHSHEPEPIQKLLVQDSVVCARLHWVVGVMNSMTGLQMIDNSNGDLHRPFPALKVVLLPRRNTMIYHFGNKTWQISKKAKLATAASFKFLFLKQVPPFLHYISIYFLSLFYSAENLDTWQHQHQLFLKQVPPFLHKKYNINLFFVIILFRRTFRHLATSTVWQRSLRRRCGVAGCT